MMLVEEEKKLASKKKKNCEKMVVFFKWFRATYCLAEAAVKGAWLNVDLFVPGKTCFQTKSLETALTLSGY